MARTVALAVDLGASGGRVVSGAFDGRLLELEEIHRFENAPVMMGGQLVWDLVRLWQEVVTGLRLAGQRHGKNVSSIGVDTWGVDFSFLGNDDALLANPVCYRDARTRGMLAKASAVVPREDIFAATGLQFMEINSLYQFFALVQHKSSVLAAAERMLMIPDVFHWLLTGTQSNERTNASTTQCFDPQTGDWAVELVERLGIPRRVFGPIVDPGTDLGPLRNEVAEETIGGIRTVRAFAREGAEQARYGAAVDRSFELARERARYASVFSGTASFGAYAAIAVVLWYGGLLLADGELSMGSLTSFLLYTFTLAMSIAALAGLWQDFMKALGASERVFELVDRVPDVDSGELVPARLEGAVSFQDVHFAYPTRLDSPVLKGLNLDLDPGGVVALVGPSGGGKSTVAALLSRFYDPGEGRILLDGVDFRELDPTWLRTQVGVVSQEPILFATTIRENIIYGRSGATEEEVVAAARAANAHEFIETFVDGYETLVGERGVRLSGGQKQRVAIARALLKDPRVLVLDEATSALDAESEHLVQEALARLMEGRTTLVIAHRLSTVKEADRVLVLDEGRVIQSGTHGALVAEEGLYRRLVERQLRGTESTLTVR